MSLWINYIDQIFLYAALALSLNLLLGYAGQVSVAHAAFGAIGGYTMAYTTQTHGWNFLLGTLLGMLLAFVIGTLVALPALKLTVEYLILLTLAVSSVILGLLIAIPDLGGTYGLINLPAASLFGWHAAASRGLAAPVVPGDGDRVRDLPPRRRVADRPGAQGHPRGSGRDAGARQERVRLQGHRLRPDVGAGRLRRGDARRPGCGCRRRACSASRSR